MANMKGGSSSAAPKSGKAGQKINKSGSKDSNKKEGTTHQGDTK
jgi:hypothetical protein